MQRNEGVKSLIKRKRLKQWEVAQAAGISEFTLSRWLRNDLTDDRYAVISTAINALIERCENE